MIESILIVVGVFLGVPILAYLVMKFGTAGWLRAQQRFLQKQLNERRRKQNESDK